MIQSPQQNLGQRDIFCDDKKVKSNLCYNIHEHYVINNIESKYLWQNFLKKKKLTDLDLKILPSVKIDKN